MKQIYSLMILSTLISCGSSSSGGGGSSSRESEDEILSGLWLSECIELVGKNYRMYFEMEDGIQKGAFLKYDDADTDCDSAYQITDGPADYNVITEDLEFSTDNKEIEVSGIAEKYKAITYKVGGVDKFTLLYQLDEDTLFVPGQPTSDDPGTDWSGWQADAIIGGFSADHTTNSYEYTKVAELP